MARLKYVDGENGPSGKHFEARYVSTLQLIKIKIPSLSVRYMLRTSDSYIRVNRNNLKTQISRFDFGRWFTMSRDDWLADIANNVDGTCRYTKESFALPHVSYETSHIDVEVSLTQDTTGRVVMELRHAADDLVIAALVLDAPSKDESSMCVQGWKAPSDLKPIATDLLKMRNDFTRILGEKVGFDGSLSGNNLAKTSSSKLAKTTNGL